MVKRYTIEIISRLFEKESYTLLSEVYINNKQKLKYRCSKGHEHTISLGKWFYGRRCPYCAGQGKPTIEFIRSEFLKEAYILLSTEYINSKQKLEYICPKEHRHYISWSEWSSNGSRCPYCSGVAKKTMEFIRGSFEMENYTLLTNKYINSKQKLEFICPNNHRYAMSWNSWNSGNRCPYCSGNFKKSIFFIKSKFEREGYVLVSTEYKDAKTKLKCICPKGHKWETTWSNWNSGYRCSVCWAVSRSGAGNPAWKGGISKELYCQEWTKDLKEFIRERDGNKCINPYCIKKTGSFAELVVHHIDSNKKLCGPENLITICRSCHGHANKNRDWHQSWYKAILNKRYKYKE